jgi:two-component system OmpR family sensor kinase
LFITTLSFIFYGYTKATIYEELKESLVSDAQLIYKVSKSKDPNKTNFNIITHTGISVDLVTIDNLSEISFETFKDGQDHYVELLYPFDIKSKKFIKIVKNINSSREMLTKIFNNLLFLSLGGLILIILYAFTVSKTLLRPILQINKKLSNMNENYLTQIKKDSLPIEFHPLADSINSLTNRIETYVRFKKELFIGAAHELKTPLAVMKLKNEVTLMKPREPKKYQDTLKLTIKQIDDMNKMIGSILDIGRAEGAQFEKATEIDLVQYMQRKTNDYRMLSAQKKITITFYANVNYYNTLLQVTLLNQIIQNFVQNAIKFTPEEKTIAIRLEKSKETTTISVIDEGIGIDEKIDLFAPFKRVGNEQGAGLGLFLAKNAADAMGAKLSLENRKDGKSGCVAKLMLYNNLVCKIS